MRHVENTPSKPKPNTALAERTVRLLASTMRRQQYALLGKLQRDEDLTATCATMKHIHQRIRWELVKNPSLLGTFGI